MLQTLSERSIEGMRQIPLANFFRKVVHKNVTEKYSSGMNLSNLKLLKSPKRLETKLKAFDSF